MNLLHYIMRVYSKEHQTDAGKGKATLTIIEPTKMTLASQVSFTEKKTELHHLGMQLKASKKKVRIKTLSRSNRSLVTGCRLLELFLQF